MAHVWMPTDSLNCGVFATIMYQMKAFATWYGSALQMLAPLCWNSNNPRTHAPWQNYLPYESMANMKSFCQNRIHLTFRRILQINPEKGGGVKISSDQKNNATFTLKTFWDRQLCFYVEKLFVSEKTQKSELCHFS